MTNTLIAIITAYCHCSTCCGTANQPTASGIHPRIGTTIAGPRSLPFGTHIHIPQVGWRIVQDRTAKRFDGRVDVFMHSHKAAKAFGVRRERITIITK